MKRYLQTTIISVALAMMVITTARAEASTAVISFTVKKGDTLTKLFGPDWQKAHRQNKVTVIRSGKLVTSPDILVEGSILTITGDVRLTPRAHARITALQQQRNQLRARLTKIAPKLTPVPGTDAVTSECRGILDDDLRFAADLDFIAREVAHLERLAQSQVALPPVQQEAQPVRKLWVTMFLIVGIVLALALFRRRSRPVHAEGIVRYREALADVEAGLKSADGHLQKTRRSEGGSALRLRHLPQ